ncbi:MAG: AMP-binding protein [Thermodesulfobacteriota bacterium]
MASYLPGFIPYRKEVIEEYTENGAWLNLTYGDLLDRAAARNPDRMAVIDESARLGYRELKDRVNRFAAALLDMGVKSHDRIVLQIPNRHEFIVSFYAMHKIGAVPVLAIPRHAHQEVSSFFRLTEAAGWIGPVRDGKTEFPPLVSVLRAEFPFLRHVIWIGEEVGIPSYGQPMRDLIYGVSPDPAMESRLKTLRPDPNDVAVLIPTGGTTGLPKMVPRTHNSLIVTNRFISQKTAVPDAVLLQATPVGHAMAMQGAVNCAVFLGATLVLQAIPRPTEMLETIQREKVTNAFMVPTQLEGIVHHPDLEKYDLRSLKIVGTAGAGLPEDVARKAIEYLGRFGCRFSGNGLGASEGLLALGDLDDPLDVKLGTVGRNVTPGSHYKVVDQEELELPAGTEGELVARGPEVFTGYYKTTEEENREVFTRDGYYRTGDLARIDKRGIITITGRRKDVIMRGGETLVPSEMEHLIRMHPSVERVAVVGMPDEKLGERACAYVVLRPGKGLAFDEMIAFLKGQGAGVLLLPERLELVTALPETGVGKIDKKALRKDIEERLRLGKGEG